MNENTYLAILREELVPAMGCTEPIAIAFAAAKARKILGRFPDGCTAYCSGNIIKNVKSVTIPGTQGQVGIEVAVLAGLIAARPELQMDILSSLKPNDANEIRRLAGSGFCKVRPLPGTCQLHIRICLHAGQDQALVEVKRSHLNIVRIEKNSEVLLDIPDDSGKYLGSMTDRSKLTVDGIYRFAQSVDLSLVKDLLDMQISCNMAIAEEGIKGKYGVAIGEMLLGRSNHCLSSKIKAYTAAASEARMCGCDMPVIINSGSGNQGITSSVPVIVYARHVKSGKDQLYRALLLSNLLTIHQKTLIGRLSAFCGVVSAACSSGAAMTYLDGGTSDQIKMTISNTLAMSPGIICDGAKPSCAAKIAVSIDAAYIAHLLAMRTRAYSPGDGILKSNIEKTIAGVGRIAREGMKPTEEHILGTMLECD